MTVSQDARRLAISALASQLAHDAVVAAGGATMNSREWRFYHGVQTAAIHVLHPERAEVRDGTSWLDAEDPAFREGFIKGSTLLATTTTRTDPPLYLRLPEPSDAQVDEGSA